MTTDPFSDVLAANEQYAATFAHAGMTAPPARGLMVITCMDSRIDPLAVLGLGVGDAKVVRTAGARVGDEVVEALLVGVHVLQVQRVLVLPHTDCGMGKADEAAVQQRVADGSGTDARSLTFRMIGNAQAVLAQDVQKLRSLPWLPASVPVVGARYDVATGRVTVEVPAPAAA